MSNFFNNRLKVEVLPLVVGFVISWILTWNEVTAPNEWPSLFIAGVILVGVLTFGKATGSLRYRPDLETSYPNDKLGLIIVHGGFGFILGLVVGLWL